MQVKNQKINKDIGFSVVELLVVIAILAIFTAITIPLSVGIVGRVNSEVYLDKVAKALQLGRITAMSESVSVFLCPSSDGENCNRVVREDNWGNSNQLILFTSNDGKSTTVSSVLSRIKAPDGNDYIANTNGTKIEFRPNGLSSTLTSFRYCTVLANQNIFQYERQLIINRIGRVRLDKIFTPTNCP